MNANQPNHPSDAARNHLLASLNALAVGDCAKCSQHLWLAARQAAVVAAQQRGWPAGTDAEIKAAMRRIDAENGQEPDAAAAFHTAELFRDNANYDFLEKDGVIWFQPIVHGFVNRMLALYPPNDWAHNNKPSDDDDTDRAPDSIERPLTSIGATTEAGLVNRLKDERRRARYGSPVQPPPAPGYPTATPRGQLQPIVGGLMSVLLEDHPTLLDDADVRNLLNSGYCQNVLSLRISGFALLRTEREGRSVSGHSRYWRKLYAGRYYVCSQWWKDYHRHNAGSLLRFVTKIAQGNPGHPGIPALAELEIRLTDYIETGETPPATPVVPPSPRPAETQSSATETALAKRDSLGGGRAKNIRRAADALARIGYACAAPPHTLRDVDIMAQSNDGSPTIKVRCLGRLLIQEKYLGESLHICFQDQHGVWYLVPHDELVRIAGDATVWLNSPSWRVHGWYSSARACCHIGIWW